MVVLKVRQVIKIDLTYIAYIYTQIYYMIIIIKGFVPRCSLATEAKLLEMTWKLVIKIDYTK